MWILSFLSKKKEYVLVISWWWSRWFYALWILKWLEELWLKGRIKAIYGVSAGAILASYRSAGFSAEEIFDIFFHARPFSLTSFNLLSKKSLLKTNYFENQFKKDLPKKISDLKIKTYIWVTNATTGKYVLFDKGDLPTILLGSMSIPIVFPAVKYKDSYLMDGWATNNFPADLAKKKYPSTEIIGIALNKFKDNQKIETIINAVSVSFEILLRNSTVEYLPFVDHLFYKKIPLNVLDINTKKMKKVYNDGYKDCIAYFKK
jgi:predicted acylesterase/phospholipase RssA